MTVRLRPMTDAELDEWVPTCFDAYFAERLRTGEPAEYLRSLVDRQRAECFPGDRPAPGHEVFVVDDDGQRVGVVWLGPNGHRPDDPTVAFLYDIEIEAAHRGRGHARAAMRLIEAHLAGRGVVELTLNVFGDNVTARHLYSRAGFRETFVTMGKKIVAKP